jgi:hypothetical protein
VIYSKTLEAHLLHVSAVLQALGNVGMTVSESKCHFAYESIELLGRRVNRLGLSTQEEKVKAIMQLPYPKTIGQASEIFGQFNYHRDFIKNFAEIALPITKAMSPSKHRQRQKKIPIKMSPKEYAKMRSNTVYPDLPEIREAFEKLKVALSTAPILAHPDFDKQFILYSDACRKGIAGALYQVGDDGKEHPILFISRGLTDAETRYSATELECLAVVWCLHKLEHFVDGSQLKLYTDHAALKWIWDIKSTINSRLFKWSLILNPLRDKVTIIHRPGRMHNNVDPLSRYPASYSINLTQIDERWKSQLWNGYMKDQTFKKIILQLTKTNHPVSPKLKTQSTQTAEVDRTDGMTGEASAGNGVDRNDGVTGNPRAGNGATDISEEKRNGLDRAAGKDVLDREASDEGEEGVEEREQKENRRKKQKKKRKEKTKEAKKKKKEKIDVSFSIHSHSAREEDEDGGRLASEEDIRELETEKENLKEYENTGGKMSEDIIRGDEDGVREARSDGNDECDILTDRLDGTHEEETATDGDLIDYYERTKSQIDGQEMVASDGTYSLINRCLYFSDRRNANLRLCIPEPLVQEILSICHDKRGHPGIRHTYSSVALRFYFPRMSRRIKRHISECAQCQLSKPSHHKPVGLMNPIESPSEPCHTLSIDFVTGLPLSHGYDALLTVTDTFSKAIRLIACHKSTTAEETAKLFLAQCYPVFALPCKIISDRDARFTSKFWSTLMHLLGIELGMSTAFHLQADGQSERTNQTVELALRCFLGGEPERYERWVDYLPILEHELNSTVNDSTKFTPNELRFTMTPRGLADLLHPIEGSSESAEQLAENLRNRHDEARDSIRVAQRKQKRYYDARRTPKEFEVGDLVLLKFNRFGPGYKAPKPHNHKLAPLGTPLRIVAKISLVAYRLALPADSRIHDIVSIAHLKQYASNSPIRPLPVIVDDHEEFEVERIDGERINSRGVTEYLVKWQGYNENERTWEPIHHLEHADEIIRRWRANRPDKNSGSPATEP